MKITDTQTRIFKVSSALPHTMTLTEREELGGVQKIFEFPNGYGASVVIHNFSYDLELALLDANGNIISHEDITDDVCGYLTVDACNDVLEKIARLPNKDLTETLNPAIMPT
jgi:predicted transcriptional regulator